MKARVATGALFVSALALSACSGGGVSSPDEALAKLEAAGIPCEGAATPIDPDGRRSLFCNLLDGQWGPEGYRIDFDRDFRSFCGSSEAERLADMVIVDGGSWVAGTGEMMEYGNTWSEASMEPVASVLGGEVMTLGTFCS